MTHLISKKSKSSVVRYEKTEKRTMKIQQQEQHIQIVCQKWTVINITVKER